MTNIEMGKMLSGLSLMLPKFAPKEISKKLSGMWISALSEFSDEQIREAFKNAASNLTEFPTAAIIKRLCLGVTLTDEQLGIELSSRIEAAIFNIDFPGWGSDKKMEDAKLQILSYVGPIGMEVISKLGGWYKLHRERMKWSMQLRKVVQTMSIIAVKKDFNKCVEMNAKIVSGKERHKALKESTVVVV